MHFIMSWLQDKLTLGDSKCFIHWLVYSTEISGISNATELMSLGRLAGASFQTLKLR